MRFRVLGSVVVVNSDGNAVQIGSRIQRVLLAVLLCHANKPVSVVDLIEAVWGESPPRRAADGLRVHIHHLRRLVGNRPLTHSADGYRLEVDPGELDAHEFDRLTAMARASAVGEDLQQSRDTFRHALTLFRGPAYSGLDSEIEQLRVGATALEEKRLAAFEECFDVELALGLHTEICGELKNLAYQHPYRERLKGQLMLALYRSDRQADALKVYELTRRRLADELGVDPGRQLRELHERILRSDPALAYAGPAATPLGTTTAPTPVSKPPSQLPAAPADFTGRQGHLDRLDKIIETGEANGTVVITALAGMAGVGKTALATHWAHAVRHRFPDGQLYINLRGYAQTAPLRPIDAIASILRALDIPPDRIPIDVDEATGLYRTTLTGRRLLLLLDNARSVNQVRPLLPTDPGSLALVTSRDRLSGLVARDGATRITLDVLEPDESEELLHSMLGDDVLACEREAIAALAVACGHLPLALRIAAANLLDGRYPTVAAYVAALRSDQLIDKLRIDDDHQSSVHAAFALSYEALESEAQRLFRLLGLPPGADISIPAAASLAGIDPALAQSLVVGLARSNLVIASDKGRIVLHDLLRAYASGLAKAVDTEADRESAMRRLSDHYLHTALSAAHLLQPGRDQILPANLTSLVTPEALSGLSEAKAWFIAEHEALIATTVLAASVGLDIHTVQLAWALATFLDGRGYTQDEILIHNLGLRSSRRLSDLRSEGRAHRYLAECYDRQGHESYAIAHCEEALRPAAELGDETAKAHTHLAFGFILGRQGHHDDAMGHARRALILYQRIEHHGAQAYALNQIGWCKIHLGHYHDALRSCQKALKLHQGFGDASGEAATWDSIGLAYHHLKQEDMAIQAYGRAIELNRYTGDRPEEAHTLDRLGDTYSAAADRDAARAAWMQALTIFDDLGYSDAERVRVKLTELRCRRVGEDEA